MKKQNKKPTKRYCFVSVDVCIPDEGGKPDTSTFDKIYSIFTSMVKTDWNADVYPADGMEIERGLHRFSMGFDGYPESSYVNARKFAIAFAHRVWEELARYLHIHVMYYYADPGMCYDLNFEESHYKRYIKAISNLST